METWELFTSINWSRWVKCQNDPISGWSVHSNWSQSWTKQSLFGAPSKATTSSQQYSFSTASVPSLPVTVKSCITGHGRPDGGPHWWAWNNAVYGWKMSICIELKHCTRAKKMYRWCCTNMYLRKWMCRQYFAAKGIWANESISSCLKPYAVYEKMQKGCHYNSDQRPSSYDTMADHQSTINPPIITTISHW